MRALFLLFALFFSFGAMAEPMSMQLENTRATLVSRQDGINPGKPLMLGILLEPKEGWHTYWENPGDAGMATSLKWNLPEGFTAGPMMWPAPERMPEGPLVTYSYSGSVFLPVTIETPQTLEDGKNYTLSVTAQWLVCKDICLPESAELFIKLPKNSSPMPTAQEHYFAAFEAAQPKALDKRIGYSAKGSIMELAVPLDALGEKEINSAYFFIRQPNIVNYAGDQRMKLENDTLRLAIPVQQALPTDKLTGILAIKTASGFHNFDITTEPESALGGSAPQKPAGDQAPLLLPALFFALLGGLVLNLMPCVLPVLSLKALDIVQKSGHSRSFAIKQGFAYTAGILLTFAALAGILLSLRSGGAAIGWGYQMQSPSFVMFLIYLMFIVGLNLSGFFHLPVLLGNAGSGLASENSLRGSFFTGVLATAVATPCTAPFMASAVGAALTMPAFSAMLVFAFLGLGLALPFLLISCFPNLLRFLPKPGAWMNTLKELLAFPMYASVIWLLWVLALQTGPGGVALAMCGMLGIAFFIWLEEAFPEKRFYSWLCIILGTLTVMLSLIWSARMPQQGGMMMAMSDDGLTTIDYSRSKLEELRRQGKPVYVDATAAWCITCQVNARLALDTPQTRALFKQRGITLMIADWTRRNDDITAFLSDFGYKGVPLNVYYPPGDKPPIVLPQVLTESIVAKTIMKAGE